MQNSKKTIFHGEDTVFPFSKINSAQFKKRSLLYRCTYSKYTGIFCGLVLLFCTSCSPTKNNIYFRNLQRDTTLRNIVTPNFELKIQKGDLLGISVASLSPDVSFYNAAPAAASGTAGASGVGTTNGYPVDENGNISYIKLGNIHAEGMTRKELKDTLEKGLIPYLKDVIVNVSFQNRHVTMLGGVTTQVLPMAGDNMTILDALAASGDIGEKGKIDNVLVIRDTGSAGNAKVFKRLTLENNSIFSSPYYYLQPNDIVYVEPVKVKTQVTTGQIIQYIASGVSLLILILNTVKL